MNLFFYDTETTGLPDFGAPSDAPQQPHIVQFAAMLVDEVSFEVVDSIDLIAKPDGWTIPEEVAAIHGITTERATAEGVPEGDIVRAAYEMWQRGGCRIGHNQQFDARIMRIGIKRFIDEVAADRWKDGAAKCTAIQSTPICKLPPTDRMKAAKRFNNKTPKLTEAYKHLIGEDMPDAHNAMGDVLGCIAIFKAMNATREAVPA